MSDQNILFVYVLQYAIGKLLNLFKKNWKKWHMPEKSIENWNWRSSSQAKSSFWIYRFSKNIQSHITREVRRHYYNIKRIEEVNNKKIPCIILKRNYFEKNIGLLKTIYDKAFDTQKRHILAWFIYRENSIHKAIALCWDRS